LCDRSNVSVLHRHDRNPGRASSSAALPVAGGGKPGGAMRVPLDRSVLVLLLLPAVLHAQANPPGQTKETEAEFIKAAQAGAPDRISAQATIARMEPKGQVAIVRQGTNGFTCSLFPDESHAPICADQAGWHWFVAAMSQQPKPPAPGGIAYMAKGGIHYEM